MLQKIIHQLNEEDYSRFHSEMEKTKANKIILLLKNYRDSEIENSQLLTVLNVSKQSFYTLKSRLLDSLELFLVKRNSETKANNADNEEQINGLIYDTPREIAIPILNYLEKEFIRNDMTSELLIVYRAFKKIYLATADYYHYSQQYNKYISYLLAQDKAEDLLASFTVSLGNYYLNRDESEFSRLNLLKKEMNQLLRLNDFPRIKIYNNILMIQFALFLSDVENDYDNIPIEFLFKESDQIIEQHYQDVKYNHLSMVMNYLYFEYFKQLKLQNKAREYFEKIKEGNLKIQLYGHICFTAFFFISQKQYFIEKDMTEMDGSDILTFKDRPDKEKVVCYILYNYSLAVELYCKNQINESIQVINRLFREISFKNKLFIETELRLFLSFLYILLNEKSHSKVITTNTLRNIKSESKSPQYENVILFGELLKALNKKENKNKSKEDKVFGCYQRFKINNHGRFKLLEFLTVKDEFLNKLKKHIN